MAHDVGVAVNRSLRRLARGEGWRKAAFVARRLRRQIPWRLARRFGWERVPFLPARLDVEPIDACNFACGHCQVTHWKRPATRLTPERLRAILDQFPRLLNVHLQGMGEPLLNRRLVDMLEECERRGVAPTIVSNGSVLTADSAARLTSLRRTTLVFSIDGATAETFEAIRTGGRFEAVVANVDALVRRRGGAAWPRIEIRTVATLRNAHELSGVVRLARRLNVDKLTISTFLTDWGKAEMRSAVEPIDAGRNGARTEQLLKAAAAEAAALDVPLDVQRGAEEFSASGRCPWPWRSAYVAANGDVVPCCRVADARTAKMGNVREEPFSKIWNNGKYRELRRRIATGDVPHYCRRCYAEVETVRPGS